MGTTASDIAKQDGNFPILSGDITQDTETVIGELAVGTVVVERGMARLYLIWRSREFLELFRKEFSCTVCGLSFAGIEDVNIPCPRCQGVVASQDVPVYPTLEAYLSHIADETGKSRQTLFNRLRSYRILSDERGVDPKKVFYLNLLSSGAASKLASVDENDEHLQLEDNSWESTVDAALQRGSKSAALEFIKYDVLRQQKISSEELGSGKYAVYREYLADADDDGYIVDKFTLELVGDWPEQMRDWINRRLGAKPPP